MLNLGCFWIGLSGVSDGGYVSVTVAIYYLFSNSGCLDKMVNKKIQEKYKNSTVQKIGVSAIYLFMNYVNAFNEQQHIQLLKRTVNTLIM